MNLVDFKAQLNDSHFYLSYRLQNNLGPEALPDLLEAPSKVVWFLPKQHFASYNFEDELENARLIS